MRGVLLALVSLPTLACYTGLPQDRAGGACLIDDDCGSGACMDGVCQPPGGPGTGLPNSTDDSSSGGGSTGEPGTTSDSTGNSSNSSSGGNTTTTTTDGSSGGGTTSSGGGSTGGVDPTTAGGTTGVGGSTSGAGDTTGGGGSTTGEPTECDPNDPNVEVNPKPGDKPGEPCCTTRDSCTGKDVAGNPAQVGDVGDQMECINGVWTVEETECTQNCENKGNTYLGCFWDSYYGLASPLCGCQSP